LKAPATRAGAGERITPRHCRHLQSAGGQDELVFDEAFAPMLRATVARLPQFVEALGIVDFTAVASVLTTWSKNQPRPIRHWSGVRDYIGKRLQGAIILWRH
jgi:hypothetical protein